MKTQSPVSVYNANITALIKKGIKSAFPEDIKPMLATLVDEPVDEPGWLYEIKWDGYRALGYINKAAVNIRSRNNKFFNENFTRFLMHLNIGR